MCPILFGLGNADIDGPLKQFQTTSFNKQDFFRLINLLNSKLNEHKLAPKILERSFDMCWPDLESKLTSIINEKDNNEKDEKPIRSDRQILEEILNISRNSMSRAMRSTVSIPSVVAHDLASGFLSVSDQPKESRGDYQDALDLLKELRKPIRYILSRNSIKNDDIDSLLSKISSFDFKVRDDEKSGDDDEDCEQENKYKVESVLRKLISNKYGGNKDDIG